MCNVPCSMCGDRDSCSFYQGRKFYFDKILTGKIKHPDSDKSFNQVIKERFENAKS